MSRIRSNRICFTLNNYTDEELVNIIKKWEESNFVYGIVGDELGEQGTPHLQGFVHVDDHSKDCGLRYWKKFFEGCGGDRMHYENANGTDDQNRMYCSKGDIFMEAGKPREAKDKYKEIYDLAKTDLNAAIALDYNFGIKNYMALKAINEAGIENKFDGIIKELRPWQEKAFNMLKSQGQREVLFIVDSEGGKGKSELAKFILATEKSWGCQGKYCASRNNFVIFWGELAVGSSDIVAVGSSVSWPGA